MTESHGQRIHRGQRPNFALSATLFFFLRFGLSFFVVMFLGVFS